MKKSFFQRLQKVKIGDPKNILKNYKEFMNK